MSIELLECDLKIKVRAKIFPLQEVFPDINVKRCCNHIGRRFRKALDGLHCQKCLDAKDKSNFAAKYGHLVDWVRVVEQQL